jgi:hypothetical protein
LKGLKHIPRPTDIDDNTIDKAFQRFKHGILWKVHHHRTHLMDLDLEQTNDDTITRTYYKPRNYQPKHCHAVPHNHRVHQILDDLANQLQVYQRSNPRRGYASTEKKALIQLRENNPSVVFKATDKNLGLAALTLSDYNQMVMAHLSDLDTYTCISTNSLTTSSLLRRCLLSYKKFISADGWYTNELKLLRTESNFKLPYFHCLPKIHKPGPLKGRPIAGATNWITTPVSRILDDRLKPLLPNYDSVLTNSTSLCDELHLANDYLPSADNTMHFITGDVTSLYPNIDRRKLRLILEKLDFTTVPLFDFIHDYSYVQYNNKVYKQTSGITMGTNCAVNLANIYMGELIDKYIESRPNHVFYYRRYIDDLFIIWTGTIAEWKRVASNINRIHSAIKITFTEPNTTCCDFLDVSIHYNTHERRISTSVFQKAMNRYLYITPTSCHVPHTLSGFISGELTRYCRICSDVYSYQQIKQQFYQRLVNRGYSRPYLNQLFSRHRWSSRFEEKYRPSRVILPFVIPFKITFLNLRRC